MPIQGLGEVLQRGSKLGRYLPGRVGHRSYLVEVPANLNKPCFHGIQTLGPPPLLPEAPAEHPKLDEWRQRGW
jgi:hypothetical protein